MLSNRTRKILLIILCAIFLVFTIIDTCIGHIPIIVAIILISLMIIIAFKNE